MRLDKNNIGDPHPLGKYPGKHTMLDALLDEIHDHYFALDMVAFDKTTGEWKMPYKKGDEWRFFFLLSCSRPGDGPYDRTLRIAGVRQYSFTNKEKINTYTINDVRVDVGSLRIVITAVPNVRITLEVGPDFVISTE